MRAGVSVRHRGHAAAGQIFANIHHKDTKDTKPRPNTGYLWRVGESAQDAPSLVPSCLCGESDSLAFRAGPAAGLEIVAGRADFSGS
jgi:hypothetical protein